MMTRRPGALWIVVAALASVLVACSGAGVGGGGGGAGAGNGAPTVDGTFSVNAVVGQTVAFDATATDPEGQDLTFQWGLVEVPSGSGAASTVTGADTLGASFVPDVVGTYVAELLVSDGTNQASFEFTISVTQGVPGEPSASNPANGAEDVPVGVTLQWDSDGASEYRVYLGTSNPPGMVEGGHPTDSYTPSEDLEYSTEYFWRIDGINADGTTEGDVWSFTTQEEPLQAPGAFDLTAPSDGATSQTIPITLSWEAAPDASSYNVYLDTSPGLSSPVQVGTDVGGTSLELSDLADDTQYWWTVEARNAAVPGNQDGTYAANGPFTFTTIVAAPGEPANPTPEHMATGVAIGTNLGWSSGGADTFDVYFGTSSNPQTLIANDTASASLDPSPNGALEYSTTYYWRVVATNEGGTTEGETWRFTTVADPHPAPGPFSLLAPVDGATGLGIPITLSWGQSADATGYRVFLGATSSFANATQIGTTNAQTRSFELDDLPNGVQRYWWVQAFNNDDPEETRLAGPFDFRTLSPPGAFDIVSPTGDSPTVLLPMTVDWGASANAESYTVTITNPRSGNTIQQTGLTATQWQVPIGEPAGVDYNRGYTVVVTAVNAAGSTEMDAGSQDFVTGPEPPAQPTGPAPADRQGDVTVGLRSLNWDDAPRANSYEVYFGTTSLSKVADIPAVNGTPPSYFILGNANITLNYGTSYRWRIDVFDSAGQKTTGQVWRFTTEDLPQIPTDAAAHWPLGDSQFKDISNNGHDGTGYPTGSPPTPISGRSESDGGGHAFNGEGQYVHAPVESRTSPLLDYSKGFALSLWTLSPSSSFNGSYLVAQTGGDAKSGFALYSAMAQTHRADYLVFRAGGTTVFQISRTLLPQSGWFHIVVNYDARNSSFDLWVNGVLTSGENGGSLLAAGDIYLGAEDSQSGYFGGGLDDVRIFNRTLTTEEITLLFEE